MRVAGDQRRAGGAERAPLTAQLLEPLASAARPIERRTRVDLLDQRRARRRDHGFLGDDRVVGRVAGVEPGGQLGAELAHHVGAQQLPLPVGREAEGEQLAEAEDVDRAPGLELEAQQLHLEGQRLGARGGGVDARAEALEQGAQLGVERRRLALGGAPDPQRPHQPVDRQALLAGHLGDPARDDAAVEVHLPEPVLAVAEALGEPEVVAALPASMWGTPQRSRRTRTGPSSPASSIVPFCFGSGRRASQLGHPALDAGDLLDLGARLEAVRREGRLLDPVELEVADPVFGQVVALDVPALFAVLQPVGLDRALGELVLVLLVVLEVEHAAAGDRLVDDLGDFGVAAARRGDLEPLLGGVVAEGFDDLGAGALQAALGQVVAEEVDRRDQRLRLERQQAGRAGEVVAVGLGVDLDLVALDFGVEDVGAAAEVDDVEQLDVFLQLLAGQLEPVAQVGDAAASPPAWRTRSGGRRG